MPQTCYNTITTKKERDTMALTNEDLQAISDMMDKKLNPINGRLDKMGNRLDKMDDRLDKMDDRLDKMDDRLDKMDNRLTTIEVKQNRMSEQLTEMQLSQKLFEMNANKKLARLQDGMDTMEEIMKMNELIPM